MVTWTLGCMLGKGSQGEVWMNEDQNCAIKRCLFDYYMLPIVLRELYAFSVFRNVPHVLNMQEWRINEEKTHVEIAMDLYQNNLRTIIETNRCNEAQIKIVMIQILKGLANIHSRGFIHRDIKPDNILINTTDGKVAIGDFGLMRMDQSQKNEDFSMTEGMQTVWYRAPEIIQKKKYNTQIDIWSAGIILAEMINGEPVFVGVSEEEQLQLYMWVLEEKRPSQSLFAWIVKGKSDTRFCPDLLDFLQGLLHFDPKKRFTAEQALSHPWLNTTFSVHTFPVAIFPALCPEDQKIFDTYRAKVQKEIYELTLYYFQICVPHFEGKHTVLMEEVSEMAELIEYLTGTCGPYILCSQSAKILFGNKIVHCSF